MNPIEQLKNKIDAADLWHKEVELVRGEYLKVGGSKDTNLYFVVNGSLRIFFEDEFEEQTIRLAYRGNFIAALDSFISDQASDLYIQALKKTQVKIVTKSTYLDLVNSDAENLRLWYQSMLQLIYEQLEREKDILTFSPLKRYQRVLKRSPQLFQEIPHKYIASYLRMTPETLSRIKKS
ncbi:MAG: Crp/Fnr family transcriptional regulator [Chitinophagales bacterium]